MIVLKGCAQRVNDMLRGIDGMAYSFENDSRIQQFMDMAALEEDPTIISDMRTARDVIRNYEVFNDAIDLVQMYAIKSGVLVDSSTIGIRLERYYGSVVQFDDMSQDEWIDTILRSYHRGEFYSGLNGKLSADKTSRWMIYAKSLPTTSGRGTYKGNLIVLLNENYFLDFFSETQFEKGGFLYGWNLDGGILLNENHSDLTEQQIQDILNTSTEEQGYINRDGMTFTWLKDNRYGLTLVVGVPNKVIMRPVKTISDMMRILIVIASLIAVLIGFLAVRRLTRRERSIYEILTQYNSELEHDDFEREIDDLARNNHIIMERLDQYVPHQQIALFYNLLFGGFRSEEEMKKAMQDLRIDPMLDRYTIIILHITETEPEDSYRNLGIKKMFIREKIQESFGNVQISDLKRDELVMLVTERAESDSGYHEDIDQKMKQVLEALKDMEGMSLAITGDTCDTFIKIPRAFRHATVALGYEEKDSSSQIQWYKGKQIEEESDEEFAAEYNGRKERVVRFIHEHYHDPQMSLTMVADAIGVTEIYLSKLFKHMTGDNFSKYVESLRMKEAGELLAQEEYSISDVAEKVGYNSPQVFRRAYHRYYGISPSEARKSR